MISTLNDLQIVPLGHLILHEAHDPGRLAGLKARMEVEGVQRNPIIVSPYGNDYLVLDGAHRLNALRELGCAMALVQAVELEEVVESWAHVLRGFQLPELAGVEELEVPGAKDWLVHVTAPDGGERVFAPREKGLEAEVEALWMLQSVYPKGVVRRIDVRTPIEPGQNETMVRYKNFTPEELVEVVRLGRVLPAGITRFRVSERVLGVRFPLEKLRNGIPEERNEELKASVREFWEENRIRYYGEPVVLFE